MSQKLNLVGVPVPVADLGAVTISQASPAVFGKAAHGCPANTPFFLSTTGTLPAPFEVGKVYYVKTSNANDFTASYFPGGPAIASTSAGAGVHTAVVEVFRVDVSACKVVGIEVKNTGAQALDAFTAHARFSDAGNWQQVSALATDYTNAVYPVKKASASPVTLAAGATAWVFFDVEGMSEFSVRASAAVGSTTLEVHASAKFSF